MDVGACDRVCGVNRTFSVIVHERRWLRVDGSNWWRQTLA